MYPHLIEVHGEDGTVCAVNIDHIVAFADRRLLMSNRDEQYSVQESYDELKKLVRDAGCIIQKKDPRLDDKPMEWEDFIGQNGEIFWNSNTLDWYKYVGYVILQDGKKTKMKLIFL